MTTNLGALTRPTAGTRARARSLRKTGLILGIAGLLVAMLSLLASIAAASHAGSGAPIDEVATSAVIAFGVATLGFATVKTGISVILLGIVRRLWVRVEAVKSSLPQLIKASRVSRSATGVFKSPQGPAIATHEVPPVLPIHRMAQLLWAPMLVMGVMLVAIGFLVDLTASATTSSSGSASAGFAWAQGLMFLGETALLAGISFLLGTILGALRAGGSEIQRAVGVTIQTLKMPTTAKAFIGLMVAGVMVGVVQFLGYALVALSADSSGIPAAFAVLGPLRELGLGLLLSGIVLALATIARVLGFQFGRITDIIETGR